MTSIQNTSIITSLDEFWLAVDDLDWKSKFQSPNQFSEVQSVMLRKWSADRTESFRKYLGQVRSLLYHRLFDAVKGLGDDSYNDLLCHIIGLGRSEYDACMADPKVGAARASRNDFKESFEYCIPYRSTYNLLDPNYYVRTFVLAAIDDLPRIADFTLRTEVRELLVRAVASRDLLALLKNGRKYVPELRSYNYYVFENLIHDLQCYLFPGAT